MPVSRIRRWNKNDGCIRAGAFRRLQNRVEYRTLQVFGAAFARGNATDHIGAVLNHLLGVKSAFAARKALHNQFRFFIYEHAQEYTSELQSHSFISYAVFCL